MKENAELSPGKIIYSVSDLKNAGFSYYQISRLAEQRKLIRLNKSFYENADFSGNANDFYYVDAFVSGGVVCLMSAAVYYDLSTFRPESVDVAVPQKRKISTFPKQISFTLHYFSDERFSLGVQNITEGENSFKIYDMEKTVADVVSNRNKIGIEETKEILVNYLSSPQRNLNKLYRYAEKLSCLKTLKTYLEVLV